MFQKTLFGQLFQKLNVLDDFGFRAQAGEMGPKKGTDTEKEQELIWVNIIFISLWHFLAIYYSFALAIRVSCMLIMWSFLVGILGGLGVTGGAHRLWAHRSYKAKLPFKIFILILFTLAGQNSVYDWVRDHRVHHKYSDTDADPHNASRGFFFSHVGWLMVKKHREVIEKGKTVDMSDIENDPLLAFQRKYFIPLKIMISFVIPSSVPPLVWKDDWIDSILAICVVRYIASLNITWSVNSAAHIWGSKPYAAKIRPSQNKTVSFLSLGEGWHNYHHVFPWDYKAAELGPYSSSLTTKLIDFAAALGLCYDRKEPSKDLVEKVARRHGDGSWEEYHGPFEENDVMSK